MHFPPKFLKKTSPLLFPWCICSIVYMELTPLAVYTKVHRNFVVYYANFVFFFFFYSRAAVSVVFPPCCPVQVSSFALCLHHVFVSEQIKMMMMKSDDFCRAMLCISAAIAVMLCPSVRPSVCHVRGSCQNE